MDVAKPQWIVEELERNPQALFWQFYFREDETKIGREVRGAVPSHIVPLLEEYLEYHRPLLVGNNDPGTLFINRTGGVLLDEEVIDLVGDLTARYAGRRVTPHMFRDSYAHCYLDENPEDYLSLSEILWHTNIQTTIQKYGRSYDESHGICKSAAGIERRKEDQKLHNPPPLGARRRAAWPFSPHKSVTSR